MHARVRRHESHITWHAYNVTKSSAKVDSSVLWSKTVCLLWHHRLSCVVVALHSCRRRRCRRRHCRLRRRRRRRRRRRCRSLLYELTNERMNEHVKNCNGILQSIDTD